MTINFKNKIRPHRSYNAKNFNENHRGLSIFESDRGRIINSAAIRRLQQKTQVFPLERNAAVRSRLTHSMEVQQVGRYISQTILKKLGHVEQEKYGLAGLERQFESIVEMACLMHDVGNPSFGHFGEEAIKQWFHDHIDELISKKDISDIAEKLTPLKTDLCAFEGNAQALRIVHSLLTLNLTYTQMSGIIKYTRRGDQAKPEDDDPKNYLKKKVGYYLSEVPVIKEVNQTLSIEDGCRSPFAYVMEAADDISYCIADIEDAVEKGILKFDELLVRLKEEYLVQSKKYSVKSDDLNLMEELIENNLWRHKKTKIDSDFFVPFRVAVNTKSVDHASDQFIANIDAIFHGTYNKALMEDDSCYHALLETLKKVAFKYVFCASEVQKQELQGYRIIAGLLDIYKPLLTLDRETFSAIVDKKSDIKTPLYQTRLFNKLSGKHISAYNRALKELGALKQHFKDTDLEHLSDNAWEFYFRCRLIQDYISGMTDQFAYDEYRALHVIDN